MQGVRFKGREATVKLDRPRRDADFKGNWQGRDETREYRGAKTKRDFRREGAYEKRGPRR
ncbi:hypothetical protein EVA_14164 [gut metagenome]|uniref:Uncharacterized protein n=1 Tax=gut metagenome TaxID=749906 RepID=J9GED4_9ZZZZ